MSETTADVVIIGGGIVGSSIAYHLTEAGCTNVLVVEREAHQGQGSTGKSMGGVRAQFATPVNIQMSLYSINFFAHFDEVIGHPADYRPHGYLFVATSQRHLDYLKANHQRQQALGLTNVAVDDARANFYACVVEGRIGFRFRRELAGREIVDAGVADGARGKVSGSPNHKDPADNEFCAWLHDWNISSLYVM